MRKAIVFLFLAAIVALPGQVVSAQNNSVDVPYLKLKEEKKPKSVPEPSTMLLLGAAAAGLVGVRKLIRRNRG